MTTYPPELEARYAPVRQLGLGGMGAVYLAEDAELGRPVAVKLMLNPGTEEFRLRFRREAELLASIEHPNVLRVFDYGEVGGIPYLVTEYLAGKPGTELPPGLDVVEVMGAAARGLQAIHETGLIHRDIKPANLFRTSEGRILVLDFGLAVDPKRTRISMTGQLVGTAAFLAPEVMCGVDYSPASDVYAWGVTLFGLVEGVLPFGPEAAIRRARSGDSTPPPMKAVSPDSEAALLVGETLQPDPSARPSVLELITRCQGASRVPVSRKMRSPELVPSEPPPAPPSPPRGRPGAMLPALLTVSLAMVALVLLMPSALRSPPAPTTSARELPPPELTAMVQEVERLAGRLGEDPSSPIPERVQHGPPDAARRYADPRLDLAWPRLISAQLAYLDATRPPAKRDEDLVTWARNWTSHLALHIRDLKVRTDLADSFFHHARLSVPRETAKQLADRFDVFQQHAQETVEARLHEGAPGDSDVVLLVASLEILATSEAHLSAVQAVARALFEAPSDELIAAHHGLTAPVVLAEKLSAPVVLANQLEARSHGESMALVGDWLAGSEAARALSQPGRWRLRYAIATARAGHPEVASLLALSIPVARVKGFRGRPPDVRSGARALEELQPSFAAAATRLRAIAKAQPDAP